MPAMPRQARLDVAGVVHHVMARGIEGREIFRDEKDREGFLARLTELVGPGRCRVYAWALMSNHVHLLLRPEGASLSSLMRRLMTGHAVGFNLRHGRKGHLFQNRYKSIVVEEEPYFLELVRYISLNPVRAGVVRTMSELDGFAYTGHAVVVGCRQNPSQDVEGVLGRFGASDRDARRGYREFIEAGFGQGPREEFRGGGLVRSAGGVAGVLSRRPEEREAADPRILGGGEFVEAVWKENAVPKPGRHADLGRVLSEVSAGTGVSEGEILGASQARRAAMARRLFYVRAQEEGGASAAELGRLTGRSHVGVAKALRLARAEREREAEQG